VRVVILGNGVTGISAALRLRQLQPDWRIQVVSGESTHHYSRPALMYVFMGHMRYQDTKPFPDQFWKEQRIELVRDWVTGIDTSARRLECAGAEAIDYDHLLIATGSRSNRFGWPGQDLAGVQGLYGLQDLKLLHDNMTGCARAVIVGGGLIGIELAEMLLSRGVAVTFLVRESSYWNNVLPAEESEMINRLIRSHRIDLQLLTELKSIGDDGGGRVTHVITGTGERIDCQLVGLTAGVSPNLGALAGSGIETGRGVLVDRSMRTSAPGVLAAGDCAEIKSEDGGRNLLQQVWYTGKMQGELAAQTIAGREVRYDEGTWFNSAKFFDLEYQVYGDVNRDRPGERSHYWEHPDGDRALRIVTIEDRVIGINLMGIRFRHEVCEAWIREQRTLDHVLERLGDAAFDPEFHRFHALEIAGAMAERLS